jgi:polyisoprenoid-binding protein YceI
VRTGTGNATAAAAGISASCTGAELALGTRHVGFEATGEIRRTDFGLGFGALGAALGDVVKIELDLEFIEPG